MENKVRKEQNAVKSNASSTVKVTKKLKIMQLKNTGSMKSVVGGRGFFVSLRPGSC